jgi:hypothetical protein
MARKRMLAPTFWDDDTIGGMSKTARLLFLGMVNLADDEGRLVANAKLLKARVFAYDDDETAATVEAALQEIAAACRSVTLYEVDERRYFAFLKWTVHQRIEKGYKSELPPPPGWNAPKGKPPLRERKRGTLDGDTTPDAEPSATDPVPVKAESDPVPVSFPERSENVPPQEKRREEKNGVTDVTPSDADAPPRLSVVGGNGNGKSSARKKKPETAEEAELREMQKSLQAKLGRYPFSKNNAKFLTRYREHGSEAIERAVEEWRERTRDADRFDDMAVLKAIDSALRVTRPKTADPGF